MGRTGSWGVTHSSRAVQLIAGRVTPQSRHRLYRPPILCIESGHGQRAGDVGEQTGFPSSKDGGTGRGSESWRLRDRCRNRAAEPAGSLAPELSQGVPKTRRRRLSSCMYAKMHLEGHARPEGMRRGLRTKVLCRRPPHRPKSRGSDKLPCETPNHLLKGDTPASIVSLVSIF